MSPVHMSAQLLTNSDTTTTTTECNIMTTNDLLALGPRAFANVRHRRLLTFLLVAVACTLPAALMHGQAGGGNASTNIPVLAVIEDEDPKSIRRSSDMAKRVRAELSTAMQFLGFRMMDEESILADLRAPAITDRTSKIELVSIIKIMNSSPEARHHSRAWALVRIHAAALPSQNTVLQQARVRIDGEVYDSESNQFLDAFEIALQFPATPLCVKDDLCIQELVGTYAREVAGSLGKTLALKLERYSPPTGSVPGTGQGYGISTTYTIRLEYFEGSEARTILGVLADEFPGSMSLERIRSASNLLIYAYQTTANAAKLDEWFYILLSDMGFNTDKEISLESRGTTFRITKLFPTPNRPISDDERRRFR